MKDSGLSQMARRTPDAPISWLMDLTLARPRMISLAAGFTDNESLPVEETRELMDAILRSPRAGRRALQYGTTAGEPRLRQLTAAHLKRCDGSKDRDTYTEGRVLITSGSQQLLYMVTEALCDPGDIVLVEDPTYFVYLGITQSHGLRCRGVRLDEDGIDIGQLDRVLAQLKRAGELRRVKLLYLVSYFQNPTGRTTSLARKAAALELLAKYERAAGHPIYLVEDAAYRELRFAGGDIPSALVTKFPERVVYAGTYSKPFATGARVGFGVLPPRLFAAVTRIKGNHDFGTSNLLQQLLLHALANGAYDRHLPALRKRYAAKAARLAKALRDHFPGNAEWAEPRGGLYIWARLPASIQTGPKSELFNAALKVDVLYVPGVLCYCDDDSRRKPDREMRLSFGGAKERDFATGIERLAGAIRSL